LNLKSVCVEYKTGLFNGNRNNNMVVINRIKTKVRKMVPESVIGWYHLGMALLGALRYGFPAKKIKVIGVTGTNGKSTTVIMIAKILEEGGFRVAVSSSVEFRIGDKIWKNKSRMTMPGRFALQKLLSDAVTAKCQYAVIEVSSEGIKQHRHRFIDFEAAVVTNVTAEHIEAHGSFGNYLTAKGRLFAACRNIHVVNLDDPNYEYFAKFGAKEKYAYTLGAAEADSQKEAKTVCADNFKVSGTGSSFEVEKTEFNLKLLGKFNIYNALAAISVGLSQGVDLDACKAALAKIEVIPGRMDQAVSHPFKVFIDYAVTPDSLEKAYQAIRGDLRGGRLICVLGSCGGGRDKWKRPVMGNLAKKYCDQVVVTNEDPYDEDPMKIINEIASGGGKVKKIIDRRAAIREALACAKPGDSVLVTGKGCEDSMCLSGGKKIPWSDKSVIKEEFSILENKR